MVVWIYNWSMIDGLEGGKVEGEEISLKEVKVKYLKLLYKGNDNRG